MQQGWVQRVGQGHLLAACVGEELRLPAPLRRHLAVGGLLHDIGKLGVPLDILRKPGPLDDHEFAEIRRHPCDVYDALVSDRVYRGAWNPERALALLRTAAFDPEVVGALERVLGSPGWVAGLTGPARDTESTHGPAARRA